MSLLKATLTQLEARLQSIVEGSAARLFPSVAAQKDLVQRLTASKKAGINAGPDETLTAPNMFTLVVHPERAGILRDHKALLDELASTLQDTGIEAGLCFISPPTIRIAEDANFTSLQVQVMSQISSENLAQTTELGVDSAAESAILPENAFLIVNSTREHSLSQSVTNIGRSPDNQLVIDDPRISRAHAQLRLVKGRFVIFDLASTGGSFVNGQNVHQFILLPGDVISLSGVP